MRVHVYEHVTASGDAFDESMIREGRAMRDALCRDLLAIPGMQLDDTNPELAIVIAPETDGILEAQVARFRTRCQVLASSPSALALTRDKFALAELWMKTGVPTPRTTLARAWPRDSFPLVVKPRDGAGSCETYLIRNAADWLDVPKRDAFIAQDYIPGQPASIAFLVGPRETMPLMPTFQHLSNDGRMKYLGGELPIPDALAKRAVALGRKAIAPIDGLMGYVGVDLILGEKGDFAIEINPRFTTSYIGLREIAEFNLAEAMLAIASGRSFDRATWKSGHFRFDPDGAILHQKC